MMHSSAVVVFSPTIDDSMFSFQKSIANTSKLKLGKMKGCSGTGVLLLWTVCLLVLGRGGAFSVSSMPRSGSRSAVVVTPGGLSSANQVVASRVLRPTSAVATTIKDAPTTALLAASTPQDDNAAPSSWAFNPWFASLLAAFIGYAVLLAAPGVPLVGGDYDTAMLAAFLEDPLHPSNVSIIFVTVFNLLGVMPMIISTLMIPQGSKQGLPAGLFAMTGFTGFPGFAPYLVFRAPPVERKTLAEASWLTVNVLDNKIFGAVLVALVLSVPLTTGLVDALLSQSISNDILVSEFWTSFESSKFVSVSTFDLACLTATAATLIPRDYQLRASEDDAPEQAKQQGRLIALATTLLPILGAALYIALRPPLPEE